MGITGLIDIPSSRMDIDGILRLSHSKQKIADITNFTYQATPWLQTNFRYTIFNPDNKSRRTIYDTSDRIDGLNDRSYAIKLRLIKEGRYIPEISIGAQDIIGTGAWSSEYIVASKMLNNLDFTIGMGWGRLAERDSFSNPIKNINDNFSTRKNSGGKRGGKLRSNSFFRGEEVGLFGGFSYYYPKLNIRLLAEYNSDSYSRERYFGTIDKSSPYSYGIEWTGFEGLSFILSHQQGNQLGISFSSSIDTKAQAKIPKIDPFYSSIDGAFKAKPQKTLDLDKWYDRLFHDMEKSGLLLRKAKLIPNDSQAIIEFSNLRYNLSADSVNRALTLSQLHLPRDVKNINLIINESGIRAMTFRYFRSNSSESFSKVTENYNNVTILPPRIIRESTNNTELLRTLNIDMNLATKFQFFDPDKPLKSQIFLKINTIYNLTDDWNLHGSFAINLKNNFDLNRGPNSSLPFVRTEINKYLVEGDSGIDSLFVERRGSISENAHYRLYAGILELMYSGIGAEFIIKPFKSRLAYGSTVNFLNKRGYKRDFELDDYKVATGYLSLYYATPFFNYDLALHIGSYLAKDKGSTIEIRRSFDNGFSIGAFATFTDVSSADFGEGSFDKGIYFKIPFDSISKGSSRSSLSTLIRPIQRDGGQFLHNFRGKLWHDLRSVRYDSFGNNKKRMIPE